MSSQNPYDYLDQTTINGNKFDFNYNRFGTNEKPLYVYKDIPQPIEVREVKVNDLVNDAWLDRLQNVTKVGVRRRDDYILKEPTDLKMSGAPITIYKDNSGISTADKYHKENHNQGRPKERYLTTKEFEKELRKKRKYTTTD